MAIKIIVTKYLSLNFLFFKRVNVKIAITNIVDAMISSNISELLTNIRKKKNVADKIGKKVLKY